LTDFISNLLSVLKQNQKVLRSFWK